MSTNPILNSLMQRLPARQPAPAPAAPSPAAPAMQAPVAAPVPMSNAMPVANVFAQRAGMPTPAMGTAMRAPMPMQPQMPPQAMPQPMPAQPPMNAMQAPPAQNFLRQRLGMY